jgi:hypothetical protein
MAPTPGDPLERGPVSQQMWHNKDPSRHKGPERRAMAEILHPFTGNGDISIF